MQIFKLKFFAEEIVMARLVLVALSLSFVFSVYQLMGYKGGQVNAEATPPTEDPAKRSKQIQATMYNIIHNLALPDFDESGDITDRFILLMPGEVLNFYYHHNDYYYPQSLLKPGA